MIYNTVFMCILYRSPSGQGRHYSVYEAHLSVIGGALSNSRRDRSHLYAIKGTSFGQF